MYQENSPVQAPISPTPQTQLPNKHLHPGIWAGILVAVAVIVGYLVWENRSSPDTELHYPSNNEAEKQVKDSVESFIKAQQKNESGLLSQLKTSNFATSYSNNLPINRYDVIDSRVVTNTVLSDRTYKEVYSAIARIYYNYWEKGEVGYVDVDFYLLPVNNEYLIDYIIGKEFIQTRKVFDTEDPKRNELANINLAYSLEFPKNWQVFDCSENCTSKEISLAPPNPEYNGEDFITYFKIELANDYFRNTLEEIRDEYRKSGTENRVTFVGKEAYKFTYTRDNPHEEFAIIFTHKSKIYSIYTRRGELNEVKKILSSVSFID